MGNSSAHDAAPSQANVQESGPVLVAPEYASAVYEGYSDSSSYNQSSNTLQVNDGDKGMGLRTSSMLGPAIDVNSRMLPTVFRYGGGGKSVEISGSFVEWKSNIPLVRSRNDFFTIIDLPEGIHEFKYLVDGEWVCDNKQDKVPNPMGTENNRIEVKSSDFEVFEALGIDCTDTGHSDGLGLLKRNKQPGSPPGEYAQIMPPKDAVRRHGPPILPGHLLQFLLNQEIASHCEPTLLPEPNHVMLNHLYALSIKDGVMVLSTTHRYRKKYITTLLYKPIP